MYFPAEMNFQYFFFNTYIGYFLQSLPLALSAGALYGILRYRNDRSTPLVQKLFASAFVCYLTGLFCLVIGLDLMGILYHRLFYHTDPGRTIGWFSGEFDLIPDFFTRMSEETIGNLLMFLPFGALHPLAASAPSWKSTIRAGVLSVCLIEILQPIVGRAFDLNDILLNTLGILLSASLFFGIRRLARRERAS